MDTTKSPINKSNFTCRMPSLGTKRIDEIHAQSNRGRQVQRHSCLSFAQRERFCQNDIQRFMCKQSFYIEKSLREANRMAGNFVRARC